MATDKFSRVYYDTQDHDLSVWLAAHLGLTDNDDNGAIDWEELSSPVRDFYTEISDTREFKALKSHSNRANPLTFSHLSTQSFTTLTRRYWQFRASSSELPIHDNLFDSFDPLRIQKHYPGAGYYDLSKMPSDPPPPSNSNEDWYSGDVQVDLYGPPIKTTVSLKEEDGIALEMTIDPMAKIYSEVVLRNGHFASLNTGHVPLFYVEGIHLEVNAKSPTKKVWAAMGQFVSRHLLNKDFDVGIEGPFTFSVFEGNIVLGVKRDPTNEDIFDPVEKLIIGQNGPWRYLNITQWVYPLVAEKLGDEVAATLFVDDKTLIHPPNVARIHDAILASGLLGDQTPEIEADFSLPIDVNQITAKVVAGNLQADFSRMLVDDRIPNESEGFTLTSARMTDGNLYAVKKWDGHLYAQGRMEFDLGVESDYLDTYLISPKISFVVDTKNQFAAMTLNASDVPLLGSTDLTDGNYDIKLRFDLYPETIERLKNTPWDVEAILSELAGQVLIELHKDQVKLFAEGDVFLSRVNTIDGNRLELFTQYDAYVEDGEKLAAVVTGGELMLADETTHAQGFAMHDYDVEAFSPNILAWFPFHLQGDDIELVMSFDEMGNLRVRIKGKQVVNSSNQAEDILGEVVFEPIFQGDAVVAYDVSFVDLKVDVEGAQIKFSNGVQASGDLKAGFSGRYRVDGSSIWEVFDAHLWEGEGELVVLHEQSELQYRSARQSVEIGEALAMTTIQVNEVHFSKITVKGSGSHEINEAELSWENSSVKITGDMTGKIDAKPLQYPVSFLSNEAYPVLEADKKTAIPQIVTSEQVVAYLDQLLAGVIQEMSVSPHAPELIGFDFGSSQTTLMSESVDHLSMDVEGVAVYPTKHYRRRIFMPWRKITAIPFFDNWLRIINPKVREDSEICMDFHIVGNKIDALEICSDPPIRFVGLAFTKLYTASDPELPEYLKLHTEVAGQQADVMKWMRRFMPRRMKTFYPALNAKLFDKYVVAAMGECITDYYYEYLDAHLSGYMQDYVAEGLPSLSQGYVDGFIAEYEAEKLSDEDKLIFRENYIRLMQPNAQVPESLKGIVGFVHSRLNSFKKSYQEGTELVSDYPEELQGLANYILPILADFSVNFREYVNDPIMTEEPVKSLCSFLLLRLDELKRNYHGYLDGETDVPEYHTELVGKLVNYRSHVKSYQDDSMRVPPELKTLHAHVMQSLEENKKSYEVPEGYVPADLGDFSVFLNELFTHSGWLDPSKGRKDYQKFSRSDFKAWSPIDVKKGFRLLQVFPETEETEQTIPSKILAHRLNELSELMDEKDLPVVVKSIEDYGVEYLFEGQALKQAYDVLEEIHSYDEKKITFLNRGKLEELTRKLLRIYLGQFITEPQFIDFKHIDSLKAHMNLNIVQGAGMGMVSFPEDQNEITTVDIEYHSYERDNYSDPEEYRDGTDETPYFALNVSSENGFPRTLIGIDSRTLVFDLDLAYMNGLSFYAGGPINESYPLDVNVEDYRLNRFHVSSMPLDWPDRLQFSVDMRSDYVNGQTYMQGEDLYVRKREDVYKLGFNLPIAVVHDGHLYLSEIDEKTGAVKKTIMNLAETEFYDLNANAEMRLFDGEDGTKQFAFPNVTVNSKFFIGKSPAGMHRIYLYFGTNADGQEMFLVFDQFQGLGEFTGGKGGMNFRGNMSYEMLPPDMLMEHERILALEEKGIGFHPERVIIDGSFIFALEGDVGSIERMDPDILGSNFVPTTIRVQGEFSMEIEGSMITVHEIIIPIDEVKLRIAADAEREKAEVISALMDSLVIPPTQVIETDSGTIYKDAVQARFSYDGTLPEVLGGEQMSIADGSVIAVLPTSPEVIYEPAGPDQTDAFYMQVDDPTLIVQDNERANAVMIDTETLQVYPDGVEAVNYKIEGELQELLLDTIIAVLLQGDAVHVEIKDGE
jgi:hypothetical protein